MEGDGIEGGAAIIGGGVVVWCCSSVTCRVCGSRRVAPVVLYYSRAFNFDFVLHCAKVLLSFLFLLLVVFAVGVR